MPCSAPPRLAEMSLLLWGPSPMLAPQAEGASAGQGAPGKTLQYSREQEPCETKCPTKEQELNLVAHFPEQNSVLIRSLPFFVFCLQSHLPRKNAAFCCVLSFLKELGSTEGS